MTPETLTAIHAHALADYPREACGLVVIVRGVERYWPCRNIAETPSEHFILSPEDHAEADDAGEIIMVVHSHPGVPSRPSQADKVGCEAHGLPWHIVSVMKGEADSPAIADSTTIQPSGYVAPLVGRTFHHGVLDCWSLCRDWYAREWGLELPNPSRPDGWWDDGMSDLYRVNLDAAGFLPVARGAMRKGDMVLMIIRSKNLVPNHAAIYAGDGMILHHLYGRLSSRDLYGGYFQEKTALVVRHSSAPLV
jgi:proteasome lid subunit RPN8/RPN11